MAANSPHNLSVALTSFVGRDKDLARLCKILEGETTSDKACRLLTLTGPGGVGKSRLGLEVARRLLSNYSDGIWLVELATLTDGRQVAEKVAQVLGVLEIRDRPLLESLIDYLRSAKILLLVDNCEHLLFDCALLFDRLLRECPNLQIVVTSREKLNIAGETVYQVPPLDIADSASNDPAALEAVKLFLARAGQVQPDQPPQSSNIALVYQICKQLDGLPLAIELAAARTSILSLEQITSRLSDRFRLLTGGSRTALPRQQTLQALIDWSYELLSQPERILFRRLAIFRGSWTLHAAEEVGAGAGLDSFEILDCLNSLINKSLVTVIDVASQKRYQMLQTIAEYADKVLVAAGEESMVSQAHFNYYAKLAQLASLHLWQGHEQLRYLNLLEEEYANLRQALEWSGEHLPEGMTRLVCDLTIFWDAHGYLGEGRRWQKLALAQVEKLPLPLQARLCFVAGWLAHRQNDFKIAEEYCLRSLNYYNKLGDKVGSAQVLINLGWIALAEGKSEKAEPYLLEGLRLAEEVGATYSRAGALAFLGLVALSQWDYNRAEPLCQASVDLCQQSGSSQFLGWALTGLAAVKLFEGEFEAAHLLFQESLAELEAVGDTLFSSYSLIGLGVVALLSDRAEQGVRLFGLAEARREALGTTILPVFSAPYELAVIFAATQLEEARLNQVWSEGRTMTPTQILDKDKRPEPTAQVVAETSLTLEEEKKEENNVPSKVSSTTFELTSREQEVLRLLAAGLTNLQIAHQLNLSSHTVNGYLKTVYGKLGVNSRSAATRLAIEQNLI